MRLVGELSVSTAGPNPHSKNETLNSSTSHGNYRSINTIISETKKASDLLAQKKEEELTIEELKEIGLSFNEASHYKKASHYFFLALKKIELNPQKLIKKDLLKITAECWHGLANGERELGRDDEACKGFNRALIILNAAKENNLELEYFHEIQYRITRDLGITYLKKQEYLEAANTFAIAMAAAKSTNKVGAIPAVKSYFGLALVLADDSEEMTALGFENLDIASKLYPEEQRETSLDVAADHFRRGRAFEHKKDYKTAKLEYEKALSMRLKLIDPEKIGSVYYHNRLFDVYVRLGGVYSALGLINDGKEYLLKARAHKDALKELNKTIASTTNLVEKESAAQLANLSFLNKSESPSIQKTIQTHQSVMMP